MLCLATHNNDIILIGINIKLQSGANDACSNNTSRLTAAIAKWLNAHKQYNPPKQTTQTVMQPWWISSREKEECGISNNITGGLLCPIDYDWDDPEYVICSPFFFRMIV